MSLGGNRTVFSYIPFPDFAKKGYPKDVSLPLKVGTPILRSSKDNKLDALKHQQMDDNTNQRRPETTRQLLERFFKPEFTPHLEKWMDRASKEEQKVILRLIEILHNKQKNDPRHKLEPIHIGHLGKIEEGQLTSFPDIKKKETLAERLRTAQNSRRVHWSQSLIKETPASSQFQRPTTSGSTIMVAELRTEFDIYPDWRAPLREVVPMTQVPYRDCRKKNRERQKLNFNPNRFDFVIHPEWFHP